MNSKQYTFHVHGMHCQSCVILIESTLKETKHINDAKVNLAKKTLTITGTFPPELSQSEIASQLTELITAHGYTISTESQATPIKWNEFFYAIPITITLLLIFLLLQKTGLVNLINSSEVNYGTAFLIGLIASVSSCLAIVGGLVLSLSANYTKIGDRLKPQLAFHLSRLITFFILGGVIGALGYAFQLSSTVTLILNIFIGIIMLLLGFNLLDVFHFTKKLLPSTPKFISKHAFRSHRSQHLFAPLIIGFSTFFLPCGFTQSMQIYTLSTGNFLTGALTMLSFALGTLPVLAILSFSSFNLKPKSSGIFFKTAGLIVITLAIFNLLNGLAAAGIIPPIINL